MADISKILLNNIEYNVKDGVAREAIENMAEMKGADKENQQNGSSGLVPAPNYDQAEYVLTGSGQWLPAVQWKNIADLI